MKPIWSLFLSLFLFSACDELLKVQDQPNTNNGGGGSRNTTTTTTTTKPTFKPGRFFKELPTQSLGDILIQHDFYAISYVSKQKNPEWVAYEVQSELLEGADVERSGSFKADPKNPAAPKSSDYTNSGYDRGHMASAEDMSFDEKAMEQSFFMSNISPQEPNFNRGIWKSLESRVRKWAKKDKRLYVVTGPILPKRITTTTKKIGEVVIPTYYYKVILDYDLPERKGIAFIFENKESKDPLTKFAVPIAEVEKRTGINFFPTLSAAEQQALETKIDLKLWDFQ
jgi:endonuclease G